MLMRTPASWRRATYSPEAYCTPWSEWWINPGSGSARGERHLKSPERKARVYPSAQMPAHTLAGVGVQDRRQVAEARGKPDVGDVGDPDLVESVYLEVLGEVRVSAKSMSRICGWHKA